MPSRVSRFFQRHPILREVCWWALPALIVGAVLRVLLLSYLPLGYWGTDSKSYFGFAHRLVTEGGIDYDAKRRYLYPLLMVPVSLLPGAPLRWVGWLQHGLGLLSILPLAYVVRKTMVGWRLWIIPCTLLYALHPMFLWYEHELLGEVVFFAGFAWAFGGWVAWTTEKDAARARQLFWWFLIPFAAFALTKPTSRFVLPGLVAGLLMVQAWRVLDVRRWVATVAVVLATLTVGSGKQGAWLLYTASFPLTQLDTALHAEYKGDIRELVQKQEARIDTHYLDSRAAMDFLEEPSKFGGSPRWVELEKNQELQRKIYLDLALEGIKARPLDFLYLTLQRMTASANISAFEESRFISTYYPNRFEKLYEEAQRQIERGGKRRPSLPTAFGFGKNEPLPPYAEFRQRLAPRANTWAESVVLGTARAYQEVTDFVKMPSAPKAAPDSERAFGRTRVTPLGWWLLASLALALCYWRTLGVWSVLSVGYFCGVYLCVLVQARFFLLVWLVFLPIVFVPLDLAWRLIRRRKAEPVEGEAPAGS